MEKELKEAMDGLLKLLLYEKRTGKTPKGLAEIKKLLSDPVIDALA